MSSSSTCAESTEFFDSLSSIPIIHRFKQVPLTAYSVLTELMYGSLCWFTNTGSSMNRGL